ncbi:MAG TPA: phosphoglucosamine mutase [Candidatus Saccharimonadia bacterium]|nr:phosphoglucosamine mutase [Candidatus Saccharimonadia bacterium]
MRYFGTDGIRGTVGEWPITADFMLRLGRAAGKVLTLIEGDGSILIGKDTRLSGYMFESALEAGLIASGTDVRLLGPMPTPAVAYLTRAVGASAGIVISASHNPHHDNGIKFFSARGEKLADAIESAIEAELEAPFETVSAELLGKAVRMEDADERYLAFCRSTVPAGFSLAGTKLVVDCGHGATYHLAPELFRQLGAYVVALGVEPDGLNINRDVGSTAPRALREAVVRERADLGIAFDGDGDRVVFVDHDGVLADGDDLIYVLAMDWMRTGRLRGPVVGTLMTNFGLERALGDRGVGFVRARVGDRYVHAALTEHGGVLGGEASGHILCLDRLSTGDGIVSALQVLDALARGGERLAQVRAGLARYPQKTVNVRAAGGAALVAHADVVRARESVETELAGRGRVVLRPSGTEPVVRVTVEALDEPTVDRLVRRLADAVSSAAP